MTKFFITLLFFFHILTARSQNVGIGTTIPNTNAALEIKNGSKGILIPRMDSVSRKNIPHTKGLLVYDSTYASFWYNTGSAWQQIVAVAPGSLIVPNGKSTGDMLYWNGTAWALVPTGLPGQALVMSNAGVPRWGAPTTDTAAATGSTYFFPSSNNSAYKYSLALIYARLATIELSNGGGRFLPSEPDLDFIRCLWTLQELPTDEAVLAWTDAGVQPLNQCVFDADNVFIRCMYYRLKDIVASANSFLAATTTARLDEIKVPADEKARVTIYRAEARLLRALAYYYAIDLFGGFEMITENDPATGFKAPYINRVNLFNYVESELLAIDADLPATKTNEYARVDKSTAWMILAKLYLNAQVYTGNPKYTECLTNVNKIINTTLYSLSTEYKWLFLSDNRTNGAANEILFPIVADGTKLTSYGNTTFITYASVGGNMAPADFGIDFGWSGLRTRREYASIMDATGVADKRNFLYKSGQSQNISNLTNFTEGYGITKFKNKQANGNNAESTSFVSTDFPLLRYADAWLMYAECVLRGGTGGNLNLALNFMNYIRGRSGAAGISSTDLTLNYIFEERTRELYWEGHRRTDLIRFNKFSGGNYLWQWKGGTANGASTSSAVNLYPIPSIVLAANSNMVQNAGYNSSLSQTATAKAQYDNSNYGIYKGVFAGSSGIVFININNDNTVAAFMIIDNITYNFTSAQTVVLNQPATVNFTSGANSFTFSVGANGANPAITNLVIAGHPNAATLIVKELSAAVVKCFEGNYAGDESGIFNIVIYNNNIRGLARSLSDLTASVTGTITNQTGSGTLNSGAIFSGPVSDNTISGSWSNAGPGTTGTYSGVRTY